MPKQEREACTYDTGSLSLPTARDANVAPCGPTHKVRIGQVVTYRPAVRGQDPPPGVYMIIARLPHSEETGELEYRIRNLREGQERVAHERDLRGR
jgi:hypothetical protein